MQTLPTQDRLPSPYRDETTVVAEALTQLQGALDWPRVVAAATPWVQSVRDNPPPFWAMESLLKEYPISSAEGLALMRLAEALLRIPDTHTAVALAADQLGRANFDDDKSGLMSSLSQQALSLSKKFLPDGSSGGLLGRLGAHTVVAATMRAVALLGRQFVLAESIDGAIAAAAVARREQANVRFSFDMLGEGARTQADADLYLASYENAIKKIAINPLNIPANPLNIAQNSTLKFAEALGDGISIKLSALHPRCEWSQRERVLTELVPRVWGLCELAAAAGMNLTIDAEEVDRLELSLDVLDALCTKVAAHCPQWRGLGLAMQAYQGRAMALIDHVANMARRHGVGLMCRLVKGAYWDAEIKRAQELGLAHYPVFTHKHHTDISYLACARALLSANDVIYPQFATHNAATIAAIAQLAHAAGLQPGTHYELQRLHGMGTGVYREVLRDPRVSCRVYAPVGSHRDLLAYLVRRLLENGANASFVHQLADESVGTQELLLSPLRMENASGQPLPAQLFSQGLGLPRVNSAGVDFAVASHRAPLDAAVQSLRQSGLPRVSDHDPRDLTTATPCVAWASTPVADRAASLLRAADALESNAHKLCALLIVEAHKTPGDAWAELREAVDFLRYYALEAQRIMQPQAMPGPTGESNTLQLKPRGVWVCISPWNFPLAIFVGQVAAALATGNTVLAKPAEQTPAIAAAAIEMLHAAGVPQTALRLVCGPGHTVGAALVGLPGVAGVVFTGSTAVAKIINRSLAAKDGPITPLIAETGGINAMVVDSSALPEQVSDAAIQSAFKSAGQRCSALRVLCVHEAVAQRMTHMIAGAAAQLHIGPSHTPHGVAWDTDVGPLIDTEAFEGVHGYVTQQAAQNLMINQHLASDFKDFDAINLIVKTTPNIQTPTLLQVPDLAQLRQEVFGPVLHIVKWRDGEGDAQVMGGGLAALAQAINAQGYGLTLGIHTRIDSRAQEFAKQVHVGNVYINRNIIGAVVGSQPFGGEGQSGTGPKAGGPNYLMRFCAEQTVTVNTTAAGGNVGLLAG